MSVVGWAALALALQLSGLVLAFGVRTWLHLRMTGSTGFRGLSGRPASPAWWGGVLFAVGVVLGATAPLLVTTGTSPSTVVPGPVAVAGLVLGVAGLVLVIVAQQAMGTSWRIGVDAADRTALVVEGPFQWVRNPIFTGMVAISVGTVLMAPTVLGLAGATCLAVAVEVQVRSVEEPHLRRVHGTAYRAYEQRSGRFLPRFTRPNRAAG